MAAHAARAHLFFVCLGSSLLLLHVTVVVAAPHPSTNAHHTRAHPPTSAHRTMFSKLFAKKSEAAGGEEKKPWAGDEGELWYIEGKAYDLAKFLKAHPGTYAHPSISSSSSSWWDMEL
jgi:hypothetical protein